MDLETIPGLGRKQPGERTPLNAFVALPDSVRHGPDEPMTSRRDELGSILRRDTDHPTVILTVGHQDEFSLEVYTPKDELSQAFTDAEVRRTWQSGWLDEPRRVLMALCKDFPELTGHTCALVVIRHPEARRSMGVGFALDTAELGRVLWDETGWKAEAWGTFLTRRYSGQEERDDATTRRQHQAFRRESELPTPTTRFQAIVEALEYALRRDLYWLHEARWQGRDLLAVLPADLRSVVESNLDLLWDSERDEPRALDDLPDGAEHLSLTRYLAAYQ